MAWPSLAARTKDWGTEVLTDSDLEGQIDLIITYINDMMDSTSGHKHDATTAEGPKILINNLTIASRAQGDIYYDNGTNPTRLAAGTSGYFLKTQGAGANPVWADAVPTVTSIFDGCVVQNKYASTASVITTTTTIANDDSIPQNTEGVEVVTVSITPKSTTNRLIITASVPYDAPTAGSIEVICLFQDTTANALACASNNVASATGGSTLNLHYEMAAGTTSSTTFKIRIGSNDNNTLTVNGEGGARKYGGVSIATINVMEVKAS